ncbi:2-C-methyl-D-erythritol 4-phosphate cytidylyltransferase [Nocardia amamiensis]|uniref:2-C-methyl-D-erythritol 4-phosphate cytidylyltransferase n=1 Tax=Nocardia amamiensis TaxID=404578 RepID=UPI000A046242|nr:2-C-methyl-D-erythritol 4-phosphate cytidylyltransferase [Nocardia amamiensis]
MPIPSYGLRHDTAVVERQLIESVNRAIDAGIWPVVVVGADRLHEVRKELRDREIQHRATVIDCPGPATRSQCLARGLAWLEETRATAESVLVYDSNSRPVASVAVWRQLAAFAGTGVDVAAPTTTLVDSVKLVDADGVVRATIDRAVLRTIEFPRMIRVEVLHRAVSDPAADGVDELAYAMGAQRGVRFIEVDRSAFTAPVA